MQSNTTQILQAPLPILVFRDPRASRYLVLLQALTRKPTMSDFSGYKTAQLDEWHLVQHLGNTPNGQVSQEVVVTHQWNTLQLQGNKIMPSVATWTKLEDMLYEVSPVEIQNDPHNWVGGLLGERVLRSKDEGGGYTGDMWCTGVMCMKNH